MAKIDAIDMANYTTVPTPPQIECLKRQGVRRVVVGASYGTLARAQLEAANKGGLELEIYGWVSHPFNPVLLKRAFDVTQGLPIKKIWLDCESPVNGRTPDQVLQDIRDAIQYVKSFRPDLSIGIYSANWWWRPSTNNYSGRDICKYDLWLANYRDPTGVDPVKVLFGGWTLQELDMWQYAGTVSVCDLNLDLNVILPRSNRMYTDEQIDAKDAELKGLIGNLFTTLGDQGSDILRNLKLIQELGRALADHIINHSGSFSEQQTKDFKALLDETTAKVSAMEAKLSAAAIALAGSK